MKGYLNEEIRLEQLVRNLDLFRSFLEISAQMNGKLINASKIAKQVGVDTVTVQSYYQILEDTWMGFYSFPENVSGFCSSHC